MSYLSEAHSEWHSINGKYAVCPLDCGANEPDEWGCPACDALCYAYPSDEGVSYRGCADPAACDVVIAAQDAAREAAKAAASASAFDDPWAQDPPF